MSADRQSKLQTYFKNDVGKMIPPPSSRVAIIIEPRLDGYCIVRMHSVRGGRIIDNHERPQRAAKKTQIFHIGIFAEQRKKS